jgi:putative ABC transport system permease protein
MNIKMLLRMSIRSLGQHKMRSLLTTLGIIIGVTAIITVMSIGEGAKVRVKSEIEKLGTNFIIALSKPVKQRMMLGKKLFKQATFDTIMYECDGIDQGSPASMQNVVATFEGNSQRTNAVGVDVVYFPIREWDLIQGNFFTASDVKSARKVALLGLTSKRELFGSADPIGKTIRIKNIPFKVIGVLGEKGTNPGGQDEDDTVFIPITTFQRKIAGVIKKFQAMIFSARSKDVITKTALQISSILRQEHKLKLGDEDDFTIFTQDDISQATEATYTILNLLLFAVASIALLVGGIGIMNIMLVSVTERTQEIGLRMALGALQGDILNQFLFEAVIICLFGGFVGVGVGISLAIIICKIFAWPVFISKIAIVISLLSSIFIGIFFGYYPAYKASMLNPVDALAER